MIFTNDAAVVQQLRTTLLMVAFMQPFGAVVFVLDGILIGAGDSAYLAKAMAAASIAFFATAALVVGLDGNLNALWAALSVFMLARLVGMGMRYRGRNWMVLGARESGKSQ